ncbi:MAG TPA: hypothetical protein ENK18_01745 [Deltaproteobacteria bacterium]|nr:hypothetical protein [Deltaproteobacteria bacterium]
MLEIDSLDAFHAWLARGSKREPAACQALSLLHEPALEVERFAGSLFLGCELSPLAAAHLVETGALVICPSPRFPFPLHRAHLYTPEELFAGLEDGPEHTYDHRVYQHYLEQGGPSPSAIDASLARCLHDHAITDALREQIRDERVVAIMGGHAMERSEPEYHAIARISRALTRLGYLMISGGGPGAMEATHLGAWFAHFSDDQLEAAIEILSPRPDGAAHGEEHQDPDWLARAWRVRQRWMPERIEHQSIGIPTWLYGHEPPTPFATKIAKYFANSLREEGLLAIAQHGVIFAKGSAGTTQEIFQDAAQNHYASFGSRSPMILFGREHWTKHRPVWPLLQEVARGRIYDELLFLTDDEEAVIRRIQSYVPEVYRAELRRDKTS